MRAFAYLSQGQAGWVEKAPPQATGFDGIIRPLLVSPCTSDVHNVEIGCLAPHRILGHEGLEMCIRDSLLTAKNQYDIFLISNRSTRRTVYDGNYFIQ